MTKFTRALKIQIAERYLAGKGGYTALGNTFEVKDVATREIAAHKLSKSLHMDLVFHTMEPKKDDPGTISGPSDRRIEYMGFLLNCPFYGAQFI